MIYLDHAATTPVPEEVAHAVYDTLVSGWGNPSSQYPIGKQARDAVAAARETIAAALGCKSEQFVFTSCGSESDNWAVRLALHQNRHAGKHIITTAVEHSAILETCKALEQEGCSVTYLKPDKNGDITASQVESALRDDTALVTMMLVNNETGYIMPVRETFMAVKRSFPEIITHCDCVQGYMKLPIKAASLGADLISLSAHKIHGVKGVGAIYIKKGVRVIPIVTGGKQEKGIRSGTESVPLIAAFGAAVDKFRPTIAERYERVSQLKAHLLEKIGGIENVAVNSPSDGSPYVINISAVGKRSEIMLHFLESKGIYVSSGSACSKGQQSGVLGEFGISGKRADGAVRISITAQTTEEELDEFAEALAEGMTKIRG